jgi:hypothetical protein
MSKLGRRSVLCGTAGLAAAGTFARPFIANAQAKTATVLWVQGFVKEEDEAFKNMGAAYEKASGNKIELAGTADVSSWHSPTCCVAPGAEGGRPSGLAGCINLEYCHQRRSGARTIHPGPGRLRWLIR